MSDILAKKLAVYTAIFGDYDHLVRLTSVDNQVDYICFTDQPFPENYNGWQIRNLDTNPLLTGFDSTRKARMVKWLPHHFLADHDYTVFIDANMDIISSNFYKQLEHFVQGG